MNLNKVISIILLFTLVSCGLPGILDKNERKDLRQKNRCNRKLERLTKKCPVLLQMDTIEIPVAAFVDSQAIAKSFPQSTNVSGVDTIIRKYQGIIDSLIANGSDIDSNFLSNVGNDIKRYIINRPCLEDEIRIDTNIIIMIDDKEYDLQISFGARPIKNNNQEIFLDVHKTDFKASIETTTQKVTKAELTDKEWLYQKSKQYWWVSLLILGFIVLIVKIKRL